MGRGYAINCVLKTSVVFQRNSHVCRIQIMDDSVPALARHLFDYIFNGKCFWYSDLVSIHLSSPLSFSMSKISARIDYAELGACFASRLPREEEDSHSTTAWRLGHVICAIPDRGLLF